jgi:hypothetical protein
MAGAVAGASLFVRQACGSTSVNGNGRFRIYDNYRLTGQPEIEDAIPV